MCKKKRHLILWVEEALLQGHRPYVLYILVMQWKLKIVLQNITAIFHDIERTALFIVDHNALIALEV